MCYNHQFQLWRVAPLCYSLNPLKVRSCAMARLKIVVVLLMICLNVDNSENVETHVNKSTQRRQRFHRREKEATWKVIDLSNKSMSDDENNSASNSSESMANTFTLQQIENDVGSRTSVLHRISERLSALFALEQQQLKHLESLEYRYTRLEVQTQERAENIRNELREISRRVQQLDWQSSKVESGLDTFKEDTTFLKQGFEQLQSLISMNGGNSGDKFLTSRSVMETQAKLQTLQVSVQMVRSSVANMLNEMSMVKRNVSKVMNITSETLAHSKQLPTLKLFNTKILELKNVERPRMYVAENMSADRKTFATDCWDILQTGHNQSGIYKIHPPTTVYSFYVYCDMETHGGGWTVLQSRNDGTANFYKDWQEYKLGFGNLLGEFWLGLHYAYTMTNNKLYEILIELKDHSAMQTYSLHDAFVVGSEIEGYPIKILGKYSGTAGDSLMYHAGQKFSTMDVDNDNWPEGNCAVSHTGAWWYNACDTSNLNGRYFSGELSEDYEYQGIYWYDWHGPNYSLMATRMSIRPRDRVFLQPQEKRSYLLSSTTDNIMIEEKTTDLP